VTSALISHATGRPDGGGWLVALGAVHQAAVGTWVGGLTCAVVLGARSERDGGMWLRRFSVLATGAVGVVAVTGIALALEFVRTPGAAIGTSYGAMVLTKVALFGALLVMGALNHRAVHGGIPFGRWWRPAAAVPASALVLRRRLEVEVGLAMVAIFLAASISSAPPAVDLAERQVSAEEIRGMLAPRWPRLQSPSLAELSAASALDDPLSPRTPEDIAWSEFGHNVSGLFVLAMGVLATLEQTGRAPWARHWPLIFIALTGFVAYNIDPEGWQTGLVGFWTHLLDPEVLQHRILLALTALFGLGEWRLRHGGRPDSAWRYVFPAVCIASGALLITHTHIVGDSRSAFFMELSHLALGLVSLAVGWARWLELRLPRVEGRSAGRVWGPALAVFGLLLILYREG
jgi:putative copper resistance protein D